MALRATIHKAQLNIADNDRAYYGSHSITVARHPSETDERMMVRVLAFSLFGSEGDTLEFTRGLSESDEPDLWRKDMTGAIQLWIETGLPDERRLMKACGRSDEVVVLAYGRNAALWWQGVQQKLERVGNLRVLQLETNGTLALAAMAARKMSLNVNIQDGTAWVSDEKGAAEVHITTLR